MPGHESRNDPVRPFVVGFAVVIEGVLETRLGLSLSGPQGAEQALIESTHKDRWREVKGRPLQWIHTQAFYGQRIQAPYAYSHSKSQIPTVVIREDSLAVFFPLRTLFR